MFCWVKRKLICHSSENRQKHTASGPAAARPDPLAGSVLQTYRHTKNETSDPWIPAFECLFADQRRLKTVFSAFRPSQTSTTLIYVYSFAVAQVKASEAITNVLSLKNQA